MTTYPTFEGVKSFLVRNLSHRKSSFSPNGIPGLRVWLDAEQQNTVSVSGDHPSTLGQNVTAWRNVINHTQPVAQATANRRPGYGVVSNGRRGVFFDNQNSNPDKVADYLSGQQTGISGDLPITVFLCCGRVRQGSFFDRVLHIGGEDINIGLTFSFSNTSEAMRVFAGYDMGSANVNLAAGTGQASGSIYTSISTASGTSTFTDGTAGATTANELTMSAAPTVALGYIPGSISFKGPIFEVLVYERAVSVAERQLIEGYLAHKWGFPSQLPATHPYRIILP